jgi:two-component system sensor histidine kinase/response regulator
MDDYLAKPFTLEQMRAMLPTWLGPPEHRAIREPLSLVTEAPAAPDPIDEQVLASLGRLQREGRPDIVQQLIELFLKSGADLLTDLDNGAATGDAALLYRASHALKSASAIWERSCCRRIAKSRPNGESRSEILAKDVFLTDAGVAPA